MKRTLFTLLPLALLWLISCKTPKTTIQAPKDASISINGNHVGNGSATVPIPKNSSVNIRVEKPGFLSVDTTISNPGKKKLPPVLNFKLAEDEAFVNSDQFDALAKEVEITTKNSEEDALKISEKVIGGYFDGLVEKKESGKIVTGWEEEKYNSGTVRTRLSIRSSKLNPLTFKVRLESEIKRKGSSSFVKWDRLLGRYKNLIPELQDELSKSSLTTPPPPPPSSGSTKPHNYLEHYNEAKEQAKGDKYHHEAFELLTEAAGIAIDESDTDEMLEEMKRDGNGIFKPLTQGHKEWKEIMTALQKKDKSKLPYSHGKH